MTLELLRQWRHRRFLALYGPAAAPSPLEAVAAMAKREADTGAPGGMVAVYVELALRHLDAGHGGDWWSCDVCHSALGQPWSTAASGPYRTSTTEEA